MPFVADASATLPSIFDDEATPWTEALLTRAQQGDTVVVPAHWPAEVANVILMAQRRKRIQPGRALPFFDSLATLRIEVEDPLPLFRLQEVFLLAERHKLTVYDAAYLELSQRRNLPLATLDGDLVKAAERDGSALVPAL